MGAVFDDLPGHAGFALRDDRCAWIGACSCGWRDEEPQPVDGACYDAAVDRWSAHHAAPLLEHAVPADVARLVEEARRAVRELARDRPRAAADVVDQMERWCAGLRSTLLPSDRAALSVQQRLDALVERARRDPPHMGR